MSKNWQYDQKLFLKFWHYSMFFHCKYFNSGINGRKNWHISAVMLYIPSPHRFPVTSINICLSWSNSHLSLWSGTTESLLPAELYKNSFAVKVRTAVEWRAIVTWHVTWPELACILLPIYTHTHVRIFSSVCAWLLWPYIYFYWRKSPGGGCCSWLGMEWGRNKLPPHLLCLCGV